MLRALDPVIFSAEISRSRFVYRPLPSDEWKFSFEIMRHVCQSIAALPVVYTLRNAVFSAEMLYRHKLQLSSRNTGKFVCIPEHVEKFWPLPSRGTETLMGSVYYRV